MSLEMITYKTNKIIALNEKYRFVKSILLPIVATFGVSNLIGNVCFQQTLASQFSYTINASFMIVLTSVLIGSLIHKSEYSRTLLPNGVPLPISPLLIGIELLSQSSRIISLAVRISANIVSGHTLTHMISNFSALVIARKSTKIIGKVVINLALITAIIIYILLSILSIVEFFISILQAYVFGLLAASYVQDSINLH